MLSDFEKIEDGSVWLKSTFISKGGEEREDVVWQRQRVNNRVVAS